MTRERAEARENEFRAVLVLLLQATIVAGGVGHLYFQGLSTPHCSPDCDYDGLAIATGGFTSLAVALLLVSAVLVILFRARIGRLWIIPVAASIATVALLVSANAVAEQALGF